MVPGAFVARPEPNPKAIKCAGWEIIKEAFGLMGEQCSGVFVGGVMVKKNDQRNGMTWSWANHQNPTRPNAENRLCDLCASQGFQSN